MKLLIFAHTPPPHHGQSYMVQLLLEGFGGDARTRGQDSPRTAYGIECYHINARFSRGLEDVGEFQGFKLLLIFWFCLQAIWVRFRHGVKNFYYVPAPGKRVALYRDWLIMFMCRPFFDHVILHWHAAGLAKWLETSTAMASRTLTYRLFRPVDLSIVLSRYNFADAEKLLSHQIRVVNNGVPDPCPDFDGSLRQDRLETFQACERVFSGQAPDAPLTIKVVYLAHCSREKGLFAAIEGVLRANQELARRKLPMQLQLLAAGNFVTEEEKAEFDHLMQDPVAALTVAHLGFVGGEKKTRLLREAGLFLFPTCYLGENQPVNLIEAMAFGLPIVTTRWRSLPEMLPPQYPGLVKGQDPDEIATAIIQVLSEKSGAHLRQHFCTRFTIDQHLADLAAAIKCVDKE